MKDLITYCVVIIIDSQKTSIIDYIYSSIFCKIVSAFLCFMATTKGNL